MTLVEALVVMLIVAVAVGLVGTFGLAWLRSQRLSSATYGIYVQMNLARVEAANRNRRCQVLIDTGTRQVRVVDLNDPANTADDEEISRLTVDEAVLFALPDGTSPVTLDLTSGSEYEAVFDQDGSLVSSAGAVGLQGGSRYQRISVFAGGGIAVQRWDGAAWVAGS